MRNLKQKSTSAKLIAIIFLCFCGALLLKFSAEPLAAEDRVSGPFTSYDRNGDGKLSVDEFRDSELFKRVDSNGDGLITLSEAKLAADQGVFKDQELPEPLSEAPVDESDEGKQQQAGGADWEDYDPEDSQMTKGDIRQAAKPVHPHSIGIGTQIRLPSISDWRGQLPEANQDELNQSSDTGLTVYALTSTGCPLCLRYAPTLAKLEDADALHSAVAELFSKSVTITARIASPSVACSAARIRFTASTLAEAYAITRPTGEAHGRMPVSVICVPSSRRRSIEIGRAHV